MSAHNLSNLCSFDTLQRGVIARNTLAILRLLAEFDSEQFKVGCVRKITRLFTNSSDLYWVEYTGKLAAI